METVTTNELEKAFIIDLFFFLSNQTLEDSRTFNDAYLDLEHHVPATKLG